MKIGKTIRWTEDDWVLITKQAKRLDKEPKQLVDAILHANCQGNEDILLSTYRVYIEKKKKSEKKPPFDEATISRYFSPAPSKNPNGSNSQNLLILLNTELNALATEENTPIIKQFTEKVRPTVLYEILEKAVRGGMSPNKAIGIAAGLIISGVNLAEFKNEMLNPRTQISKRGKVV